MFRFEKITPSMTEAVIVHLRDSFFADEPLNKAVGLSKRGQPHALLEGMCVATINDGFSIAAMDGDQVKAVALNGVLYPGDIERSLEEVRKATDEGYKKIFTILYAMSKELDLFTKYNVDKIFECRIVSVAEDARGQGLANTLVKKSIDLAKDNGFKLFKADATGLFSQRANKKFGMYEVKRVCYSDYVDESGAPVFKVDPPHEALAIMVLEL